MAGEEGLNLQILASKLGIARNQDEVFYKHEYDIVKTTRMTEEFRINHAIPEAEALALEVPPPAGVLSREQILSRHILVALHRELEHGYAEEFPLVEQIADMEPEEARALLEADRELVGETGRVSERLRQHNRYAADLKAIRMDQQDYVNNALDKLPQDASQENKRTAFLDALDHSPVLAEKTLHKLNHTAVSETRLLGNKLFSEMQIKEISADRSAFQQALTQVMIREPAIVLGAGNLLSKVADRQQIRTALESLRETNSEEFINHLDFALKHYSPEEAKQVVIALAEADPSMMLFQVTKSPIAELVGEDVQRDIAQKTLQEGSYLPSGTLIERCVDKGFITREAVKERLLKELAEKPNAWVDELLKNEHIVSAEDAAEAKAVVYKAYHTSEMEVFRDLDRCKLLTDEQKEALVRERFVSDPADTMRLCAGLMDRYLPADQMRELLLTRIATDEQAFDKPYLFLSSNALTLADKQQFTLQLALKNPQGLLSNLDYVDGTFGESLLGHEELSRIVTQAANSIDLTYNAYNLRRYIGYLGGPEEQKEYIAKSFTNSPTLTIFSVNSELMQDLFTTEEQMGMLRYAVSQRLREGTFPRDELQSIRKAFGDAEYRNVVEQVRIGLPESFLSSLDEVAYLYGPDELAAAITGIGATYNGQESLLKALAEPSRCWLDFVDPAQAEKFFDDVRPKNFAGVVELGDRIEQYLTDEAMQGLAAKIARENPAFSLMMSDFFDKHLPGFNADDVIDRALNDERHMSVVGRYLNENMQKVQKAKPVARDRLLVQMSGVYEILGEHIQSGTLDGLRGVHDKLDLNADSEHSLLEMYDIVTRVGSPAALAELQKLDSMEAVNHHTVQTMAEAVGVSRAITVEQTKNLSEAMIQSGPLGLYIGQYARSPKHLSVLKPMMEGLLDGDYQSWKFGSGTPESLQMLKVEGLLPPNLKSEQYAVWTEESQTKHVEAFTVETQAVIAEVKRILGDNAANLPPHSMVDSNQKDAILRDISADLSEIGQEIGKAHQELKVLQDQPSQVLAEGQIEEVRSALSEMTQARRVLQIQQDVIQLTHMADEEVRTGMLRPLAAGGKGRPLVQALQRLRKELGTNVRFISEQLEQVFVSFSEQTGAIQTLSVVDTVDPRRTIEIGETPMASCQNYRNGIMNECLLGYTDPNTKILFLTNERGNPVARSILRMLTDPNGDPVLHVESVYSADASDGVQRAVYRHAAQKAESMDMPLYLSLSAQNVDSQETEARRVAGVAYEPTAIKFSSNASRAPWVYVDSAGGAKKDGVYAIAKNARISITS